MYLGMFLTIAAVLLPGGVADPDVVSPWEVVRLDLDVTLEPEMGRLRGRAVLRVRRGAGSTGELVLDIGEAMRITAVDAPTSAGHAIDSSGSSATVRFSRPPPAGEEVEVGVSFASEGRGFQMVVDSTGALASWARTWYPIPRGGAHAAPGYTRIAMPASWSALANGALSDRTERGDAAVETWTSELPAARSFAAAPYHAVSRAVDGRTIRVHLLQRPERAQEYLAALMEILASLERRYGPYPYPGYALAEIPDALVEWGGSAEQGFFMVPSRGLAGPVNVPLFAHELAHGWWGNHVRAVMPGALIVGEALAQYSAVLAIEEMEGPEAATEFLRFSREGYNRTQSAKGYWRLRLAGHDRPLSELTGEGQDHNLADAKGHWVFHMLRSRMGDEAFFATLRSILDARGGGSLSLPQLRGAFIEAPGSQEGLREFFEQWLDRSGAPMLSVQWSDASADGRHAAEVVVRQTQASPYRLPLVVEVESEGGTRRHVVEVVEATTRVTLESDGPPVGVVVDPDHAFLRWDPNYCPE